MYNIFVIAYNYNYGTNYLIDRAFQNKIRVWDMFFLSTSGV